MIASGIELNKRLNEFDKSLITASYFGFVPIVAPRITTQDIEASSHCESHPHFDATDKASFIRTYIEENFSTLPHPLAFSYKRSIPKKHLDHYSLHIIGSPSGIAEATLIRTALSMLNEEGYGDLKVNINCIGDKESINSHEKELNNYIRKLDIEISQATKDSLKEDIFNLFKTNTDEILNLRANAPSAMTSLSYQSRAHFKEVLEYIETLGIDFQLSPELLGEKHHSSHTLFAIKENSEDISKSNILASGYRYSRLAKRLGLRREIPMASATLFLPQNEQKKIYKTIPKPKFYIIQLGREARIKTISIIELLRQNRIPAYHYLGKDKLGFQLSNAESLNASHLIIIGQKEALENTATVRNISTRAQDTIGMANLPNFLKNLTI